MTAVTITHLPAHVRDGLEARRAFGLFLEAHFAAHPASVPDCMRNTFKLSEIRHHRRRALDLCSKSLLYLGQSGYSPRDACHLACDTGAPNEPIIAMYQLLFT